VRRGRGFTLVELMVVLAVFVVIFSVAVPGMSEFTASNQVVATRSAFSAAVSLARSEAVKRNRPVVLQPLAGGSKGNEFGNGWEIVVDEDGDGSLADSELRIRRYPALSPSVTLSGKDALTFRATGALGNASDQVFTVCRAAGSANGYSVTVTPSGVADVDGITTCGS
jgi:type IV fimbrial biogenesis protein FimT